MSPLVGSLLGAFLVAVALCAAAADGKTCVFQKCWCADRTCATFTSCTPYIQEEGACGSANLACDCATDRVSLYADGTCTGAPTAVYTSGSCYDKTFCFQIESCAAPCPLD